jgi:predicted RNA-binding Zn-ribbon protein involved in translation (DUF1610 family)
LNKQPRFFCDNCGAEVGRDLKACPHCGRFFASIRCPSCGFTGEERLFARGCPSCGYSAPSGRDKTPLRETKVPASPLPLWVYFVSLAALIAMFAVLFFMIAD